MKIFAAIYIGSYELSLKIFELAAKRGIREVDYVRHRVNVGRDIYQDGYLRYQVTDEICDVLMDFTNIMKSYRVDDYRVYAGAVLRLASNEMFLLDQIHQRTGMEVEILSNSESRFISYRGVASNPVFADIVKENAAVVDISGNSVQITLFENGHVVTTQHLPLGTMRVREKLASMEASIVHMAEQVQELVDKELDVFQNLYMKDMSIQHVVLMGDYITEVQKQLSGNVKNGMEAAKFVQLMNKLQKKPVEEIAEKLNLSNDHDPLIIPAIVLYKRTVEALKAAQIFVLGYSIHDGIAYTYAQQNHMIKSIHNFDEDVLFAARNMAERYHSYSLHIEALCEMSTLIFDAMKKIHGLGKRERLLLQTAAILHDCGKYISLANAAQCSFDIISSSEIIGLTHLEREIVAYTVLYNSRSLDAYEDLAEILDPGSYLVVAKLAAILRVSNAMDRSHKQKFQSVKVNLNGKKLVITIESFDEMILEKGLFAKRTAFFEEIYSIKPVLKEKRMTTIQ